MGVAYPRKENEQGPPPRGGVELVALRFVRGRTSEWKMWALPSGGARGVSRWGGGVLAWKPRGRVSPPRGWGGPPPLLPPLGLDDDPPQPASTRSTVRVRAVRRRIAQLLPL